MRILTAAVWLVAATCSAEASSILVIDDAGTVRSPSTLALNDGRALATSPSMLTLGPPTAEPDVGEGATKAEPIPSQPTVIRAGIEGEAFARALAPGAAGPAESGESPTSVPAAAAKQPAEAQAPRAAVDPTTTTAAPRKRAASPAPAAPAPEIKPQ